MIKVGVVGATGFTGLELLRILSNHVKVSSILISTNDNNRKTTHQIIQLFNNNKDLSAVNFDSEKLITYSELSLLV